MTAPYMGHQQTFSVNGTSIMGWCTLAKHGTHLERDGTRGTRSHDVDDVVDAANNVNGAIICNPTNAALAVVDVLAIGSGGTVDETVTNCPVIVDKGADVYTYNNTTVDRLVLSGRQGGVLDLRAECEALSEDATGSAPSEPSDATPFAFSGITFTYNSTAYEVQAFELVVDNALIKDHFQNKKDRTDLPTGDRIVTLRTEHAYSSNTSGLYTAGVGAGAAATLAITDGTNTRTYTFGKLQAPADGVPLQGKGPLPLTVNWTARKDGATKEIAVA